MPFHMQASAMKIDRTRRKLIQLFGALPLCLNSKLYASRQQVAPTRRGYILVNGWILKKSDLVD